ncbi:hypothetical protein B5F18_05875 [Lachnoclostridium sp. An181]|nr:hypothetical protein B5F18_05875 [Lachnoclostridium sp. An181]
MSRDYGNTYWYLTAVEMCGVGGMMAGGVLCIAWGIKSRNNTLLTGVCVFHGRCHAITMDHSRLRHCTDFHIILFFRT